ncbi:MAG: hypothetical protein KKH88_03165 [Nanoarchaeota archaeon]|nr:hypothetical protein [Nanoarchaeota archaeon]
MEKSVLFVILLFLFLPIASAETLHQISKETIKPGNVQEIEDFEPIERSSSVGIKTYYHGTGLVAKEENDEISYYHKDNLGSTVRVTDEEGNVLEENTYLPYGENLESSDETFTFTGKERDFSGLQYFDARYYDPNLGVFTTVDPVKDRINWYQYAASNPMKYVDPTGTTITGGNLMGVFYALGDGTYAKFSWASSDQSNSLHPEHFLASGMNIASSILNPMLAALSLPDQAFAAATMALPEQHRPTSEQRRDIWNAMGATAAQFYVFKTQAAVYGPSTTASEATSTTSETVTLYRGCRDNQIQGNRLLSRYGMKHGIEKEQELLAQLKADQELDALVRAQHASYPKNIDALGGEPSPYISFSLDKTIAYRYDNGILSSVNLPKREVIANMNVVPRGPESVLSGFVNYREQEVLLPGGIIPTDMIR